MNEMISNRVTVPVGDDTAKKENGTPAPDAAGKGPRLRRLLSLGLAIVGVASLTYLLGAAVVYFELPSSGFLLSAFKGANAWYEQRQASSRTQDEDVAPVVGKIDNRDKTYDGFTLYAKASKSTSSTQAYLIDMRGEVVHKWAVSFSQVWAKPPHIQDPEKDSAVCIFACHLYPNGDLLVVFHALTQAGRGYGLVKLDKDSQVIWKYAANAHHDVDVGEDGTIYAIKHENANTAPKGLEFIQTPALEDYLVMLSPEGEELRKPIPILEAFRDSPYAPLLSSLERQGKHNVPPGVPMPRIVDDGRRRGDPLHTNSVKVLGRELASQFPRFKAGQVLISMRNVDAIAVLDTEEGSVVWAARGPWLAQHDAQFLDNGRLLIFDNLGSPKGSRVLEYDPQTQALPWSYAGENKAPFFTSERGMSQRLPNGNTLIVNSEGGEILEVTQSKELAWSCSVNDFVTTARRYSPDQLHFLKGDQRARP
jgi:hypothetical protein